MANAEALIDHCVLCLEPLSDPVVLIKCGRSFDRKCVKKMERTARLSDMKCPSCRVPFMPGDWKPNVELKEVCDKVHELDRTAARNAVGPPVVPEASGNPVVLGPTMNAAAAQSASLSGVEVEVSVNGNVAVTGSGYNVFEDPINSLCFLATEIGTYGHKIKKGDFVITGATCELQSL